MQIVVTVLNDEGLHARPAGILVKLASTYTAEIELSANENSANAKSIMSIMGMGLTKNTEVTITATGPDAETALSEIHKLFNNKFNL